VAATPRAKSQVREQPLVVLRRKMGMTQRVFARVVSVSERSLAKLEKGQPPSEATGRHLAEIARLYKALCQVVKPEALRPWFQRPNPSFGGLKPIEVIERGQIDRLWEMVYRLESGVPG
ncbi:MAG: helix-turn-helix domain-containing protein, partial [Planctomycetota bacterium]|nr:helix-turn-helix domain-containing protein [Planctomycetota bacterium]